MNRHQIQFPPRHAALRDDVHALGALVGEVLREQGGQPLYDLVEGDRMLAIRRREGEAEAAADLAVRAQGRPPAVARDLVRAFSMWFQAVNLAEKVHRIRRRRQYFVEESDRPQPGGVEAALLELRQQGLTLEDVLKLVGQLSIEPVFTAHPTESARRTVLRKQRHVAELLLGRLDPTMSPQESRNVWSSIRSEFTTGWQTEDHPRERLTVADEREHALFYLIEVLYQVVPAFYEEIAQALAKLYGVQAEALELPSILHFGSWVGGDMDGNPDVHAKTIRETLARQQQVVLNAYFEECQALAQRLSQSASRIGVSAAMQQRIDQYATLLPGARTITPARHDRMPYRVFLAQVGERLRNTYAGRANAYIAPLEFEKDILLITESLRENRGWNAGHHSAQRLLRRISTFGFHLATLDVRQHSEVHHRVLAGGFDDPQWLARPPEERAARLADVLERDIGPVGERDALAKRTFAVFDAIMQGRHRYGPRSFGYYVVSGAAAADDVLAPLVLARWAEAYDKHTGGVALDIAPSFESLTTLERCGTVMRELLANPVYRRHLDARGRRQCVLLGYSDSNKEAGICASRFAIFHAQRSLTSALREANEEPVFFHGRGGSTARGGGRIDAQVRAAPADAASGTLRLTEQGEIIHQNYGLRAIAMRTIERAFNALVLGAAAGRSGTGVSEKPEHLECAATLAAAAREAYRQLVYGDPAFYEYFRAVTPIDVIERMQIGSRPAYRPSGEGLDALRAVPWVFAWTQSRHMIPGWLGAGAGLRAAIERHGLDLVRSCCKEWFFFRNLVDDVEAMLGRTDLAIAESYNVLAPTTHHHFFEAICAEYRAASDAVLAVKEEAALLDGDRTLQRAIQLRNPYVDPMNLMQVDLLRRWRAGGREDRDLFEALLASVGGIAQGLQSTG
ncbi:MAG TPA: phosphoenolpyruvate carboxylase [Steroidobacteraceae bacterium]